MKINRSLYARALGYYTCNGSKFLDEILESGNWDNVILWEPF